MTSKITWKRYLTAQLLGAIFLFSSSCGIYESRYLAYQKASPQVKDEDEVCAIEIAAFNIFLTPMIKERCSIGCHVTGGTAERQLKFTGHSEKDLVALKKHEDRTALGLFRKAAGIVAHSGGKAAFASDQERFEKWFAAAGLCPLPDHH